MANNSLFGNLRRLFSTDVIIRNVGGNELKVMDTGRIQSMGVLQTNALVDRFSKIYTTSGAGVYNLNNVYNYQTLRVQLYTDYEAMDTDAIVASALDIIADESTLKNEHGDILQIKSSDENIKKILQNLFYDVLNIEFNLWTWIRTMCKYGDFYLKLEIAEKYGVYNVIPFSAYSIIREEGTDRENPTYVRFKYDPTSVAGTTMGYGSMPLPLQNNDIYFENYEMAHFRLLGDINYLPYGRSYLEPGRKLFKQYVLMEDAMMIHRIMRAPEKRIFYMNVGSIPPHEVEGYMQKMVSKMKKTPYIDQSTGQYNLKFNLMNMMEDFYIPVRGNDQSTRIDTTKGLEYNGIEDVNYLRDKLFAALKVPKAFMGYEKDLTGKATLAAEDIRFARTVERIQRIVVSELTKIALVHLYTQGYDGSNLTNFELSLTTPSIIYDQEKVALLKEKVALAKDILDAELLPTDYIYTDILHLSEDQFQEYRDLIAQDKMRKFRNQQIENEGNDPSTSGQAFGTPHQLAVAYGMGRKGMNPEEIPTGYNEKNPNEPTHLPGRPQKSDSFINKQDDPLGKDRLGTKAYQAGNDQEDGTIRPSYKGGSPLALESTAVYLKNKKSLEQMPFSRKVNLFEHGDMLDENNIRDEIK
jgi:hypothetical protein